MRSPSTPEQPASTAEDLDIKIIVVDLYTLALEAIIPHCHDQVMAIALVEAGFMGNSPISPSIAISLKTLDLFKIIRQQKASFSTKAFTKILCDLYQVHDHMAMELLF